MDADPIKLTGVSYVVLGLLSRLGHATSYELKRVASETTDNFWPSPRATLYTEPARLEEAGYVTAETEATGRRRRSYTLTDAGRAALDAWLVSSESADPVMYDEAPVKLFFGAEASDVVPGRRQWHLEQIAMLHTMLEGVVAAGGDRAVEYVMAYGLAVNISIVDALDAVARGDRGAIAERAADLLSGG